MYNFVVSESAAKRINCLNSKELNSQMLRVKVEGGGCNGLKYQIGLTDLKNSDDVIFTKDGAHVVVDGRSRAGCCARAAASGNKNLAHSPRHCPRHHVSIYWYCM